MTMEVTYGFGKNGEKGLGNAEVRTEMQEPQT